MTDFFYFDHASTTPCISQSTDLLRKYSSDHFGNPESFHFLGQESSKVIRHAREYFSHLFRVEPKQVIFTGSGTEANNLAIQGVLLPALFSARIDTPPRAIHTHAEHSSVIEPIRSLVQWGLEEQIIPLNSEGQIVEEDLHRFLKESQPRLTLLSFQQVNSIVGTLLPIEDIAQRAKKINSDVIIHSDAIQSFGKVSIPQTPSSIDLISISAHKIGGPKGIGALIVLNKKVLTRLRPLIWGGGQENGFRSGTPHPGLVAAFQSASEMILARQNQNLLHIQSLQNLLRRTLETKNLISTRAQKGKLCWNSPREAIPSIISLSAPGFPAAAFARLLEEKKCLVSVGSACNAKKQALEPVLKAMGFSPEIQTSAIRISLSHLNKPEEILILANALEESIQRMAKL